MNRGDHRRSYTPRMVEMTGKSVDEAVQAAIARLRARRDEVEIEVLQEGRGGFLGIGSREARVRVRLRPDTGMRHSSSARAPDSRGRRDAGPDRRPGDVRTRSLDNGRRGGPRRDAPDRRGSSDEPRRDAPDRRASSDELRRDAPDRRASSDELRRDAPDRRVSSDELRRDAPDRRVSSDEPRRRSVDSLAVRATQAPRQDLRVRRRELTPPSDTRESERIRPDRMEPLLPPATPSLPNGPAVAAGGQEKEIASFTKGLLSRMGFDVAVSAVLEGDAYEIKIEGGDNDAVLIGRRGETLEALQHIISKMASHGREELIRVRVDVADYRERRNGQLVERAQEMAQRVRESGHEVVTEPLSAAERRIIHRALADLPDVTTHALGEGLVKRIWIGPAGAKRAETTAYQERAPFEPAERPREEAERPERPERPAAPALPVRDALADSPAPGGAPAPVMDDWNAAGPATKNAEASPWGRKPKPAKGRRAR